MTIDVRPERVPSLIDRLSAEYAGAATRQVVTACVDSAFEAIRYFGADEDAEMLALAERIAERDLRLRLGLEREVARLDPEDHRR